MNTQQENISRVSSAIAMHVTQFLNCRIGMEFHVETLRQYVYDRIEGYVAPASPDRILRDLRQKGVVNYEVVSRSQSLYRALPIRQAVPVGIQQSLPLYEVSK